MTRDKICLKIATDALDTISVAAADSAASTLGLVHDIAFAASMKIERRQSAGNNPHMGAPGGQRDLLPECPCCNQRMEPGWRARGNVRSKIYSCEKCDCSLSEKAWSNRVESFISGELAK